MTLRLVRPLTATIAMAAALVAGEVVVRLVFPHTRDHMMPPHLLSIDDHLGWKLRPGQRSTHDTRYFRVEYATNAEGFRDAVRTASPRERGRRILLYGDSFVFGWGVRDGDRFSDRLERDSPALEIRNHGVPGYGLDQEVLAYEAEPARADDVIFFVSESTLWGIHSQFIYAKYKPMFAADPVGGRLQLIPVPRTKNRAVSLGYQVFSPFYLPYFLQAEVERFRVAAPVRDDHAFVDGFVEALLRRALGTARRRHERMAVLVANLTQRDRRELCRFCRDEAIACLEISPELSTWPGTDEASHLVFGNFDKHWNAKANELIAAQLLTSIR